MPKTTVLQPNQTQFFSSKRLFISKIIVPITSTAVAVMFTFSFGSAFAVTGQTYNYTQASDLVTKTVDDLLLAAQNSMNNAVTSYTDATVSVGSTPVTINKTAAKALFQDMYDEYYNALTAAAKAQQQALADAWNLDNNWGFQGDHRQLSFCI